MAKDEMLIKWSQVAADKHGNKSIVYYDDIDLPDYQDVKDYFDSCHQFDVEPPEFPDEHSNEYWDLVIAMRANDWDVIKGDLPYSPLVGKHVLIHGHFGGWRGPQAGGKVVEFKGEETLTLPFANHIDRVKIFIDKDGLHAENCHHDGTDFYTFTILTEKGLRYWQNNGNPEYQQGDREVHEHLLNTNGYTREVRFYLV